MRKLREVIVKMAERLFAAVVVAGLAKVAFTGEVTVATVVAILVAVVGVAGLLRWALRLDERDKKR